MRGYLLDTHVWFWLLFDEPSLAAGDRKQIEKWQRERKLFLSPISVWEAAQKESSGRLQLRGTVEDWLAESVTDDGVQLIELSTTVLIAANRLPGEIHGDPVDRILVATARTYELALVTHDSALCRYAKEGHLTVQKV